MNNVCGQFEFDQTKYYRNMINWLWFHILKNIECLFSWKACDPSTSPSVIFNVLTIDWTSVRCIGSSHLEQRFLMQNITFPVANRWCYNCSWIFTYTNISHCPIWPILDHPECCCQSPNKDKETWATSLLFFSSYTGYQLPAESALNYHVLPGSNDWLFILMGQPPVFHRILLQKMLYKYVLTMFWQFRISAVLGINPLFKMLPVTL